MEKTLDRKKISQILEVIANYEFALDLISYLYKKRQEKSINEICQLFDQDYNTVHRFSSKLLKLGVLNRQDKQVRLSQTGINFVAELMKVNPDQLFLEAFSRENNLKILANLERKNRKWKQLKSNIGLNDSSLKLAIDFLTEQGLVKKASNYQITEKGKRVLNKFKELNRTKIRPKYEIQVKIKVDEFPEEQVEEEHESGPEVKQEDHYYSSPDRKQYLRYRAEFPSGSSLEQPNYTTSWGRLIELEEEKGLKIMRRQKETSQVNYPSILFLLDSFDTREIQQIKKKRRIFTQDKVSINFDQIIFPEMEKYVEIKAEFIKSDKKEQAIYDILKTIEQLGLKKSDQVKKSYLDLYRSSSL